MDEHKQDKVNDTADENIRTIIRDSIQEFVRAQQSKAEPAYKAELIEERKRREQLEQRVNELGEENKRSRLVAEEADRGATIRAELQKLGVAKIDLAFKAVKDDIYRAEDGQLVAKGSSGGVGVREYLSQFVNENPELLPARMMGGSGVAASQKLPASGGSSGFDLDKIRPGMSADELDRVRKEVSRIALQTMRGL